MYVYIIGTYLTETKLNEIKTELKPITMIYVVMGQFDIMLRDNNREVIIVNLDGIKWLNRYPWQMEITHDQGS